MKKKGLILIILLFVLAFLGAEEAIDSFSFDMYFEKIGVPDVHFEQNGQLVSSVSFPLDVYTTTLDAVYHIYSGQAVELIFVSGSATEGDYQNAGPMMTSVASDLGPAGHKLNYNVSVEGGESLVFDNDPATSAPGRQDDLPIEGRTLQVVSTVDEEVQSSKQITLTVNPPSDTEGVEGFIAGQYTGYIIMRLYTMN